MNRLLDKVEGTLYGMAVGDAMGMPPELWSRKRVLEKYPTIDTFLDGDPDNSISYQYKAGNFTDDTSQALVVLDSLIANQFEPNPQDIAQRLIAWAREANAIEMNILGPTSRVVLQAIANGEDASQVSNAAVSNGSAMRIAPVGTLFIPTQAKALCDYVSRITRVTHSSDISIAAASMIAMAVCSSIEYGDREQMVRDVLGVEEYALSLGADTPTPSIGRRLRWTIERAAALKDQPVLFAQELYDMVGASVAVSESATSALAMAYYYYDVRSCACACATLGGDTDTIGAMATAICGAAKGRASFPKGWIQLVDKANNVHLDGYAKHLYERHGKLQ